MKNLLSISESEKLHIRSLHENFLPKRYSEKTDTSSISSLMNQTIDELNFQKQVHLHYLSMCESVEKSTHLKKLQNNYVQGLFSGNVLIYETYRNNFRNLINESNVDYSSEIDKFNNFLVKSLMLQNGLISEQLYNDFTNFMGDAYNTVAGATQYAYDKGKQAANYVYDKGAQAANYVYDKGAQAANYAASQLQSAVNYIKKIGLEGIMEGLRKALMSYVGTAVQIALAFTQVGAIANEVAWGILTAYDAYQYFVNNKPGSLTNLIIDVICLLTAGTIGKALGKFVGMVGSSIGEILGRFMQSSGMSSILKPAVTAIANGATKLAGWLKPAVDFMKNKMGINWLGGIIEKVLAWFKNLIVGMNTWVGGKVAGALVRVGVTLPARFEATILGQLAQKSEAELTKLAGEKLTQVQVKAAEKYANEYLKEKPTAEALAELDKQFGTKMGDAYAAYLSTTKLASHSSKLSSGAYNLVDYQVDAIRGDLSPMDKSQRLQQRAEKTVSKITGGQ